MKIGDWMKSYRTQHGLSMQAFADLCGFSKAYVSILENGINPTTKKPVSPTMQTFKKIAEATGQDVNAFIENLDNDQPVSIRVAREAQRSRGVKIPVLGRVIAGIPIDAITDIVDYEEIPEKMAQTGDFFALEIIGTSMEPKLYEGDVVIVKKQESVDSGDIAIVLVNGDDATIKKVMIQKNGITLIAYNPSVYEPHFYSNEQVANLPIVILGKVVELRRKI